MSPDSREEPGLFDLPLTRPAPPPSEDEEMPAPAPARRARRPAAARPESLPLFGEDEDEAEEERLDSAAAMDSASEGMLPRPRPRPVPEVAAPPTAGLLPRLRAAVGDLAILGAVGVLAAAGAGRLGAPLGAGSLPGLLLFLLAWSFLYFVVSLAFWGQTPGMAWAGLVAHTGVAEPLSFGQTARRWAATWLTWALAGLPGLLALSGGSLADRLSGSRTYELELAGSS